MFNKDEFNKAKIRLTLTENATHVDIKQKNLGLHWQKSLSLLELLVSLRPLQFQT